jgi:murein tripeptide amidase MpaA
VPAFWQTRAERSGYRLTADYDETIRFCRSVAAASPWVKLESYGSSGQGRELPLLIVSKDHAFTPEAARAIGKPIILIQNGIHAGEIEGKDASLALVRDIAVLHDRDSLLDHATLLVLPIFSVDAHERRSQYNRINQNGPEDMGWRTTPIGLNLNRDYLKAESPEIRALIIEVFTRWWPHLLIDDHTTDGADYQHDVSYGFNHGAGVPVAIDRWMTQAFEGRAVPRLAAMGHLPAPYLDFRGDDDPRSGIDFGNSTPRFSTGYGPLQCRPAILVETHMLKSYEVRVRATYDLLVAVLEEVNQHPRELIDAVAAAEAEVAGRVRERDPARRQIVLDSKTSDVSVPFDYKGVVARTENSDIAGGPVVRYTAAPWDTIIPLYRETVPTVTVREPAGYLIPQEWTICRDKLDLHGVRYRRFSKPWSDSVEVQHVLEWSWGARPDQGHRAIKITKVALERRMRSYRPGDLWVPLDQRGALIAINLFEAQAPDGLTYWNAFDTVFELKEYGEPYVVEPLAKKMLDQHPALAREFKARIATDTSFAHSPAQRLDFFYRRSPWADPEQDLLPVTRALRAPPDAVLAP